MVLRERIRARYTELGPLLSAGRLLPAPSQETGSGDLIGAFDLARVQEDFLSAGLLEELAQRLEAWAPKASAPGALPLEDRRFEMTLVAEGPYLEFEVRFLNARVLHLILWQEIFLPELGEGGAAKPVLSIERLELSNPWGSFTSQRPRAPGQEFPGLGLAHRCHKLVELWALRLGASAVLVLPEFFHNAVLFSIIYRYLDEEMALIFKTFRAHAGRRQPRELLRRGLDLQIPPKDLSGMVALSWGLEWGLVRRFGDAFLWPTELMVYPLEPSWQLPVVEPAASIGDLGFEIAAEYRQKWI